MQLVEDGRLDLYDTMNDRRIGRDYVVEKFGVPPEKLGDVLALMGDRSEEHTSELQSRRDLVCRLLLEKKKTTQGFASSYRQSLTCRDHRPLNCSPFRFNRTQSTELHTLSLHDALPI